MDSYINFMTRYLIKFNLGDDKKMTLKQEIEFLKFMTFEQIGKPNDVYTIIASINDNEIVQKYFVMPDDGISFADHVFKGYFYDGSLNGYHSEYLYPSHNYGIPANNCDKKKPYKLDTDNPYATFFPINMHCGAILAAALLVYHDYLVTNPPTRHTHIAYLKEYDMWVKICMKYDNKKIFDAYPVIQQLKT